MASGGSASGGSHPGRAEPLKPIFSSTTCPEEDRWPLRPEGHVYAELARAHHLPTTPSPSWRDRGQGQLHRVRRCGPRVGSARRLVSLRVGVLGDRPSSRLSGGEGGR